MIKMVFDCVVYVVVFLFAIYVGHLIRKVNRLKDDLHELSVKVGYIETRSLLNRNGIETIANVFLNTPNTKTEKKNPEKHMSYCCGNCKYFYRKADGGLVTSCCRKGVNDVHPDDICDWYESYI